LINPYLLSHISYFKIPLWLYPPSFKLLASLHSFHLDCLKFHLWLFSFSSSCIQIIWFLYRISRFIDLFFNWVIGIIFIRWLQLWANSCQCCHRSWVLSFYFFTWILHWFHFCIWGPHLLDHFDITMSHIRSSGKLISSWMHTNNHFVNFVHHNSSTWSLCFGLVFNWIIDTRSWIILF